MPAVRAIATTTTRRACVCLSALACALMASPRARAGTADREYVIKAAFLYNFARYVEWPPPANGRPRGPLSIGVVGQDPFGDALDRIAATKKVAGRSIVVRRFATPSDIVPCHMLFIVGSQAHALAAIRAKTDGHAVLTVGDTQGLAARGVAINFYIERNKPRFEINPAAATRAGLKISSKLLRLARIVKDPGKDKER